MEEEKKKACMGAEWRQDVKERQDFVTSICLAGHANKMTEIEHFKFTKEERKGHFQRLFFSFLVKNSQS